MRATLTFASAVVLVWPRHGADARARRVQALRLHRQRLRQRGSDPGRQGAARQAHRRVGGQQGIKDYKVGKKDVSCELFLNFIVFDEHTCTAQRQRVLGRRSGQGRTTSEADAAGIEGAAGAHRRRRCARRQREQAAHAGSHKAGRKLTEQTIETPPAAAAADAATRYQLARGCRRGSGTRRRARFGCAAPTRRRPP